MSRRPRLALRVSAVVTLSIVASLLLVNYLVTLSVDADDSQVLVLLYLLGALVGGFLLAGALDRMMVRPITDLAREVRSAADEGWRDPLQVPRQGDELGDLGRALEELRAATVSQREELQHRLDSVSTLAAGVAHEVNNPNGVVLSRVGYLLQVADEEGLDPDVIEDLQTIEHQARRVGSVASGLLEFVRPGPEGREPVDLHEVLALAVALLKERASHEGVALELVVPHAPCPLGRRDRLEQVAFNLVKNALECGAKRVTVRTRPDGFEIVDDGPGIADNARARIFEPFFTTKSAQGGTGLGLAVSYGIVQDHGGTLTVDSSPSGTTFRVGFP